MALTEEQKQAIRGAVGVTSIQSGGSDTRSLIAQRRTELQSSIKPKETLLQKASGIGEKVMEPVRDVAFGSTGKTVGSLLVGGLASGAELLGKEKVFGADTKKLKEIANKNITPTNIAFTALELYPGGKLLSSRLAKLPGGAQTLEYLSKLPEGMKKKAVEQYASIFNATSKESKALVKETVPGLMERGIKFTEPANLASKAESQATTYGEKIDKYFENLPKTAKEETKPILDKLAAFKNKYIVDGKVIRSEAVNAADKTMEKIAQFGKSISTESARKMRQIFDEHYDVSKGLEDIATYTKKAERAGADAIRAEFAKTRPDLAKLNKEFTFWKNVQDLATYSAEKGKSKFTKGVSSVIGGAIGFQSGEGLSGKTSGTVIGAFLGAKAIDLMRSPAWKSFSAVEKNKLADAIMKGDTKTVELIISKIPTTVKNITQPETKERRLP